jgi:DNA-binding IclR family transcriptional regulator
VVPGACAISAPVFNRDGAAIGSLSVLCLEATLDEDNAQKFSRLLRDSAVDVSARLGWADAGLKKATTA